MNKEYELGSCNKGNQSFELSSYDVIPHHVFGEDAYGHPISGWSVSCISYNDCAFVSEFLQRNKALLTKAERDYLSQSKSERRIESYLLGRVSAKHAYCNYVAKEDKSIHEDGLDLLSNKLNYDDLHMEYTCTGKPLMVVHDKISECQVSITHSEAVGISIVSDPHFLFGIDLEWKNQMKCNSIHNFFSSNEQELLKQYSEMKLDLLFWSAKEAIGKYLGIGLGADPIVFEITKVEKHGKFYEVFFQNFVRHKVIGYLSSEFVLTLAYYDRVSRKSIDSIVESISNTIEVRIKGR